MHTPARAPSPPPAPRLSYACVAYGIFAAYMASFPRGPGPPPGPQVTSHLPDGWCYPPGSSSGRAGSCWPNAHLVEDFAGLSPVGPAAPDSRGHYTVRWAQWARGVVGDVWSGSDIPPVHELFASNLQSAWPWIGCPEAGS